MSPNETSHTPGHDETKMDLITCIVQRGKADRVVKKAIAAGAGGATVWFARGSGIRERLGLLGIAISPEKEVVTILTPTDLTQAVFTTVVAAAQLDVPGHGIAYVSEVKEIAGIHGY